MSRSKGNDGTFGCLFLAALLVAGVYFGVRGLIRHPQVKPFAGHLSAYASLSGLQRAADGAYISGKVIAIDKERSKVDSVFFSLPKDLRATMPEEVGTVIWLEWDERIVGTYTDGAKGYQITCQVTVIDKDNAAIVASQSFAGSRPPGTKSGSGSRSGSKPTGDIVQFITALPRRP